MNRNISTAGRVGSASLLVDTCTVKRTAEAARRKEPWGRGGIPELQNAGETMCRRREGEGARKQEKQKKTGKERCGNRMVGNGDTGFARGRETCHPSNHILTSAGLVATHR